MLCIILPKIFPYVREFHYICIMEVFYSNKLLDGRVELSADESFHCVKVLRHRVGDEIGVSCGDGNLYRCTIVQASPKEVVAEVISVEAAFGVHHYYLHIAVAPPKNSERFEWFAEKAVEMGIDRITPMLCKHSERKVFNRERGQKIIVSAAKQSLKGEVPQLDEITPFTEVIRQSAEFDGGKFIAFCDSEILAEREDRRVYIQQALESLTPNADCTAGQPLPRVLFLIGPEGDFSREEIQMALDAGFRPLSLGESRLRIETAALLCVSATYIKFA